MRSLARKIKAKRTAAAVLAVMLSVSMLGIGNDQQVFGNNRAVISGYADEADEQENFDKLLSEIDEKQAALDEKIAAAGNDIDGRKEMLAAVEEKAAAILEKIAAVEEKSASTETEMCDIDDAMRDTRYRLSQSEKDIDDGLQAYKERLRIMYIAGSDTYSDVLVNADSFYDVLMRFELLKRVAEHDNKVINDLVERKSEIEDYKVELEDQSRKLKEKSSQYSEEQQGLAEQYAELEALISEYGSEISSLEGDLAEYKEQAASLVGERSKVQCDKEAAESKKAAETTAAETKKTTAKTEKVTETETSYEEVEDELFETEVTKAASRRRTTTTAAETSAATEAETEYLFDTPEVTTTTTTTTTRRRTTTTTTTAAVIDDTPDTETSETSGQGQSSSSDIQSIIDYAKGMVGGSYVWAGEQYGATDCSGLVMLSYKLAGINLPHLASSQAEYGTSVSLDSIQPGDLVFFGGSDYSSIYHVAMYIGDGKIVHAESDETGIVISYLESVARYNNITCIKRLL